jgi:hypothetical protein
MKLVGIFSTAVLSLTLGVVAPVFAQEQHDQEQAKDKPAARETEKKPEPAKPEEKNAKPAQQEHAQAKPAAQAQRGRIPDERFKANFGRGHTFRVSQGDYNNRRFQYGGYSFGFVGVWPGNWLYTQNVYVVEINGVYYLCNASYPGVNLELSFAL